MSMVPPQRTHLGNFPFLPCPAGGTFLLVVPIFPSGLNISGSNFLLSVRSAFGIVRDRYEVAPFLILVTMTSNLELECDSLDDDQSALETSVSPP